MSKKILKENIRVEVDLGRTWFSYRETEKDQIRSAEDIIFQIKRHVDDVGRCEIIWDESTVCEYCEYELEVNEDPDDPDWALGEPVCCIKAQEEWKEEVDGTLSMSNNES